MGYKDINKSSKDDIPPVRFFGGKRYVAGFAGYTKREAEKVIKKEVKRLECAKGDVKKVRDAGGSYTIYYRKSTYRYPSPYQ